MSEVSLISSEDQERKGPSIHLPRLPIWQRLTKFIHDVRLELTKVAWPGRSQVWSTTVVVVIAVAFFGVYLWGCDYLFTAFFKYLEKAVK